MKGMLIGNQARSMSIFWKTLIEEMQNNGMEVICCMPPGEAESIQNLENMGPRILHFPLERKGLNPFADLRSMNEIRNIMSSEKPDLVFASTIKPVIYGLQAAWKCRIPGRYAAITGLGYAFETETFLKKIINRIGKTLYRLSLKHATAIFFQNREDEELFRREGILDKDSKTFMARGVGVDVNHFKKTDLPQPPHPFVFLLIGRLLEAKGIREYAKAAQILKTRHSKLRFELLGPMETGPGALSSKELKEWIAESVIDYLGETKDVRPYIANAHVIVLPSWREGTPTAILEAMSMGRPCIVADSPGCREVVKDGLNGFIAEVKNPESLAAAMEKFILKPDLMEKMGEQSRKMAESQFEAHAVAKKMLAEMKSVYPVPKIWPEEKAND